MAVPGPTLGFRARGAGGKHRSNVIGLNPRPAGPVPAAWVEWAVGRPNGRQRSGAARGRLRPPTRPGDGIHTDGYTERRPEVTRMVADAIARRYAGREGVAVYWVSVARVPLDGRPATGRCAVCRRWVYDAGNVTAGTPTELCRGAVVGGHDRCDDHLPPGHPYGSGGGYTGPIPPAG